MVSIKEINLLLEKDVYLTICNNAEGLYVEKRSKFHAYAYPIRTKEEAEYQVKELHKKFYDARHICYAYVLGVEGTVYRCNDDGEPSGSGGKPIWGQIKTKGLTYVLVAVVRYFGGIRLGAANLGNAYKKAAYAALEESVICKKIIKKKFRIKVPYTEVDKLMRILKTCNAEIQHRQYDSEGEILDVSVRLKSYKALVDVIQKNHLIIFLNLKE